jgi:hypothetical protein
LTYRQRFWLHISTDVGVPTLFTKPSFPQGETAVWSPTNGIKNFYFDGTDSFGMLKHYSGN